jgi:hypothetical protein
MRHNDVREYVIKNEQTHTYDAIILVNTSASFCLLMP